MLRFTTILNYLNPITRLGKGKYSFLFPLLFSVSVCIVSEILANQIMHRPNIVGVYILLVNIASLIYFSFRDGVRGGIIASVIPILYYFYIIYSRNYEGSRLVSGITTTLILGALYIFIASIIGWLKQTIDKLIQSEVKAKEQAEEQTHKLETILEQFPVGVLVVGPGGEILKLNSHVNKMLGKKVRTGKGAKLNNEFKNAFRVGLPNTPMTPEEWPITRALLKGERIDAEEIRVVREDKKALILSVNAAPIRMNNRIIAAVSTFFDITEQKMIEDRKDDFISMASHELKTPLTSITIYTRMIHKYLQGDEKAQSIQNKIDNQLKNLKDLVSELLDATNIEKGRLKLKKKRFLVRDLAEEIAESLQGISDHQLILDWHTKQYVIADQERIRQVLINLVSNAINYSPPASKIVLSAQKGDGHIVVSVQDFGKGISKEDSEKIFERFYRVGEETDKTYPGLGLGLYISYQIITMHGGKIWVESKKGKGSTFYFSLPIVERKEK